MTTVMDAPAPIAAATSPRYFYFYMALSCAAVAFLGFAPTYWLPMASGTFKANPIVHIHGMVLFSWVLFFSFQTWLAASGRKARELAFGSFRRPLAHNRLMLLASISLLDAAVARWFLTFLAPPGPPGPPPVIVTIGPALVAYLLLVVAIVVDWRSRGRPHPVYIYGGAAVLAVKLVNWPISTTAAWHALAGGILTLAQ